MAPPPKTPPPKKKRAHPPRRPNRHPAPPAPLDPCRKKLLLRRLPRQSFPRRSLRPPQPAPHLPLHVRPRLAGRLPKLLLRLRPSQRRCPAFGRAGRLLSNGLASASD